MRCLRILIVDLICPFYFGRTFEARDEIFGWLPRRFEETGSGARRGKQTGERAVK